VVERSATPGKGDAEHTRYAKIMGHGEIY
jgi:hypothetical protein